MSDLVRAAALRGFPEVVTALGGDTAALLAHAGLDPAALRSDDSLISHHRLVRLLEHAAGELAAPDLGLRVAERQDLSVLGPLALVVLHSPTLREAVDSASRYMFVHSPAVSFTLTDDPDGDPGVVALRYSLTSPPPTSQVVELALLAAHRAGQLDIGARAPVGVDLPHARLSPLERYEECFGAPVRFDRPYAALRLPASGLAESMAAANPLLRQLALDFLTARHPDPARAWAHRVRDYFDQILGSGAYDLEAVAATFGLHPRTLQRRLEQEQTSYAALLDAARRDAALRHLTGSDLPLAQVTAAVGLAEQSALTRACRRWFGTTPSGVRRDGDSRPVSSAGK